MCEHAPNCAARASLRRTCRTPVFVRSPELDVVLRIGVIVGSDGVLLVGRRYNHGVDLLVLRRRLVNQLV